MSDPRSRILARLRAAPSGPAPDLPEWSPPDFGADRLTRFTAMLEAAHAEVHVVTAADWPARLLALLGGRVRTLLAAPDSPLFAAWGGLADAPRLIATGRPVEVMKSALLHDIDAAITTAIAGIAETGTLVLAPTPAEPRLMSLLPPLHIALVDQSTIVDSLPAALARTGWAVGMPTNVVLVSGPSKTADIEQTLAYGVHGPKEVVVLVVTGGAPGEGA